MKRAKTKMLNQKIFIIGSSLDIKYSKDPSWDRYEYPKDDAVRFIEKDIKRNKKVKRQKIDYHNWYRTENGKRDFYVNKNGVILEIIDYCGGNIIKRVKGIPKNAIRVTKKTLVTNDEAWLLSEFVPSWIEVMKLESYK